MTLAELLTGCSTKEVKEEVPAEKKKFGIFDILNAISFKQPLDFTDEIISKTYDQYMVTRWLSMDLELVDIAQQMNTIKGLTNEQHFDMLCCLVRRKRYSFKYVKKAGSKTELSQQDKRAIAHYYEIGLSEVDMYLKYMKQEEVDYVLSKYQYGKNGKEKIQV